MTSSLPVSPEQIADLPEEATFTATGCYDPAALNSVFYEKLVEHVFIAEVLQEAWYRHQKRVEVLRSEIDCYGYDLVMECNEVIRHCQLKTSKANAKTDTQKVNIALAQKPGGCVVWILREEDPESKRMTLSYRIFGGEAGNDLPLLDGLKTGKHTKGNAQGIKAERQSIRLIPKTRFTAIPTTKSLVEWLFVLESTEIALSEEGIDD